MGISKVNIKAKVTLVMWPLVVDPVVDRWSRSKICQVESIEKSLTSRSSRLSQVDFSTSRIDRLADD